MRLLLLRLKNIFKSRNAKRNRNEKSTAAEVLLAGVFSIVTLCFISELFSQQFKSQSILDLAVNNGINIITAVGVAVFIVNKFESTQQRTSYIIDIVSRTGSMCDRMVDLAYKIKNESKDQELINEYRIKAKALLEYIGAIEQQIESSKRHEQAGGLVVEMKGFAKEHEKVFSDIEKEELSDSEKQEKKRQYIQKDALEILWAIQTYIPKVLGSIQ